MSDSTDVIADTSKDLNNESSSTTISTEQEAKKQKLDESNTNDASSLDLVSYDLAIKWKANKYQILLEDTIEKNGCKYTGLLWCGC